MATKKKRTKKAPPKRPAVLSVELPGEILFECSMPTTEQWDRFMDKLRRGHEKPGQRELVQTSSTSHSPAGAAKILARFPMLPSRITDELNHLASGECQVEVKFAEGVALLTAGRHSVEMSVPDFDAWESFQTDLETTKAPIGPAMRKRLGGMCSDKAAAAAMLEEYPGIIGNMMNTANELTGANLKIEVKKE